MIAGGSTHGEADQRVAELLAGEQLVVPVTQQDDLCRIVSAIAGPGAGMVKGDAVPFATAVPVVADEGAAPAVTLEDLAPDRVGDMARR